MDETYLKIKGSDVYLYRAVDKYGKTVDFLLSKKRDKKSAFSFFSKAISQHGLPDKVTMDKSGANKAGLNAVNFILTLMSLMLGCWLNISMRQIKYLNNIVEQDHRAIKRVTKPMMGFKAFQSAKAAIELHHMLKKGQHNNADEQTVFEQFYALAA